MKIYFCCAGLFIFCIFFSDVNAQTQCNCNSYPIDPNTVYCQKYCMGSLLLKLNKKELSDKLLLDNGTINVILEKKSDKSFKDYAAIENTLSPSEKNFVKEYMQRKHEQVVQ